MKGNNLYFLIGVFIFAIFSAGIIIYPLKTPPPMPLTPETRYLVHYAGGTCYCADYEIQGNFIIVRDYYRKSGFIDRRWERRSGNILPFHNSEVRRIEDRYICTDEPSQQ